MPEFKRPLRFDTGELAIGAASSVAANFLAMDIGPVSA